MSVSDRVLHQFRFSHFNEKARWALDHKGLPHRRRSYLPGMHVMPMLWRSGQKQLPVLCEDGSAVVGSAAIIDHLERLCPDPPLYPAEPGQRRRALELQRWFDAEIGAPIRAAGFHDWLGDGTFMAAIFAGWKGPVVHGLYRAAFPLLRRVMRADMGLTAAAAADGLVRTAQALDLVGREAGPDGYLVGDRFSVADLTAAAILAPTVMPAAFPYPLPRPYPEVFEGWLARWRGHPGTAWVQDMYARHRGTSRERP